MDDKLSRRRNLLLKNSWSHKDISEYMELIDNRIGQSKATEMKNRAAENGGSLVYKFGHVTVDSVLDLLGTTKAKELSYLSILGVSIDNKEGANNL